MIDQRREELEMSTSKTAARKGFRMGNIRILSTVSAIALTAGVAMSAHASTSPNLIVDLGSLTISPTGGSAAAVDVNNQANSSGSVTTVNLNTLIGFPAIVGPPEDIGGSANIVTVDTNTAFSDATGNEAVTEVDNALATGVTPANGAIAGNLQSNVANTLSSLTDGAEIRIDVIDAGADDSINLTSNSITADTNGNVGTTSVGEDIAGGALVVGSVPLGYTSDEEGQVQFNTDPTAGESGVGEFEAAASYVAGSVQLNSDVTTSAIVDTGRIGLDVNSDGGIDVVGTPMVVDSNLINASLTGNDATNIVNVEAGGNVELEGSVAVANLQINTGGDDYDALVTNSTIVATIGDSDASTPGDIIDSNLTFTNNEISADATGNTADNSIVFAPTVSQEGPTTEQANEVSLGGPSSTNVQSDMIISSTQINDVNVTADVDSSILRVDTEGLDGSSVVVDNNTTSAVATSNDVTNTIDIEGSPTFDTTVGVNNNQYTTGDTVAGNNASIVVDVAGEGQDYIEASLTVDGNDLSSEATGNEADNLLAISATNVVIDTATSPSNITTDRTTVTGSITADLSLLNNQVVDGGDVIADSDVSIAVDVVHGDPFGATATGDFEDASASISDNFLGAAATGNLTTQNRLSVDATTVSATAGVANAQTIEDGSILSATLDPGADNDLIDVDSNPDTFIEASLSVDRNRMEAVLFGNLATEANSLSVMGTNVDDGGEALPNTIVDRSGGLPVSYTQAGFMVSNDQSVEDLDNGPVTVRVSTGDPATDLINARIEFGSAEIASSSVSMNFNEGIAAATLNDATSELTVAALAGLDASSALTNTQTVAAENGTQSVEVLVQILGGFDLDVEGQDATDITDTSIELNDNLISGSARLNRADNTVNISATSQSLVSTASGDEPSLQLSSDISRTDSETSLVNDQYFDSLGGEGVVVSIDDADIFSNVGTNDGTGDLVRSPVEVDRNSITSFVEGNAATNTINLDVGSFDLSAADDGPGARRGPVAVIASNQRGDDPLDVGFTSEIVNSEILADIDGTGGIGEISGVVASDVSANDNTLSAFARVNAVQNTLEADGTTFITDPSEPDAEAFLFTAGGNDLQFDNVSFGIGSRQENAFDVLASIDDGDITVAANIDSVDQSALTTNGNAIVTQARGSDSVNVGGADFGTNEANFFVGNVQLSTDDVPNIGASITNTDIVVTAAQSNDIAGPDTLISDSALTADDNAMLALASANRTDQTLNVGGTNIYASGTGTPSIVAGLPNPDTVTADFGIVNSQGMTDDGTGQGDILTATVNNSTIEVLADTVLTGVISADRNDMIASAVIDSASNQLTITALANVGIGDDSPSSAVFSRQLRDGNSSVASTVFGVQIGSIGTVGDISDPGGVGISVDANIIGASATVGTAINSITVESGASINGDSTIVPSATIGSAGTADVFIADHAVFNHQRNLGADSTASVGEGVQIGAVIGSGGVNDAISIDDNLIEAVANGFISDNRVTIEAGSESNVTAQVGNEQLTLDASVVATISGAIGIDGIGVGLDGGLDNTAASASRNNVLATAQTNQTTNVIITRAEATMQESDGLSLALTPGIGGVNATTDADYAVLNVQATIDGFTTASIAGIGIGVGVAGALDEGSISVNDNNVQATAIGNDALNVIVVNAGAPAGRPSVAIGNLQSNTNQTISASVSDVSIGASGVGAASASSVSVSGNSVGASAIGNRSFNSIGQ